MNTIISKVIDFIDSWFLLIYKKSPEDENCDLKNATEETTRGWREQTNIDWEEEKDT